MFVKSDIKLGEHEAILDCAAVLHSAHESAEDIFGSVHGSLIKKSFITLLPDYLHDTFLAEWKKLVSGQIRLIRINAMHVSGYVIPLEVSIIESQESPSGQYRIQIRDLSARRKVEVELNSVKENYVLLAETTTDAILQIDYELEILFANSATSTIFGFEKREMLNRSISMLFPDSQYQRYKERLKKYFVIDEADRKNKGMMNVLEVLAQKKSGEMIPAEISLGNSKGVGENRIITCIIRDITLRKKADRRLRYLAYHDKLTSLGNRDRFAESLSRILEDIKEKSDHHAALLYLDLDGFKKINDSLGHEVGDAILKACAKRLGNCLRQGDQVYQFDFEEIFRVGGDEFTILLPYIRMPEDAAVVARRVIDKITQPFTIEDIKSLPDLRLGVSIGIAIVPSDGLDATTLLRNADAAMYKAKEKGNRFVFFTEEISSMVVERLMIEEGIRRALARNEFELYYQPIVDSTGKIFSVEALIRWNHPEKGVVSPGIFISVAEDIGLIHPLGTWVLSTACKHLREFHTATGNHDITVSVNLSPLQLEREDLAETVHNILKRSELDTSSLALELTENALMESPELAKARIERIKHLNPGIRIAIDDFGTGYSSLAYLANFTVDNLKIDQSFVAQMEKNEYARVVKTIIELGSILGLKIIAEGVEKNDQLQELVDNRCHYFQGYLFKRAVPKNELRELLISGNGVVAAQH